jgi:activator of 2-hydroxyglutaryl-CoA dehydratase
VEVKAKQLGLREDVAFVGGVAKNTGIKTALERELGLVLFVPFEPQITGALGGALCGKAEVLAGAGGL